MAKKLTSPSAGELEERLRLDGSAVRQGDIEGAMRDLHRNLDRHYRLTTFMLHYEPGARALDADDIELLENGAARLMDEARDLCDIFYGSDRWRVQKPTQIQTAVSP